MDEFKLDESLSVTNDLNHFEVLKSNLLNVCITSLVIKTWLQSVSVERLLVNLNLRLLII